MEDALKLNFLKIVPRPFFVVEVLVFRVTEVNCVRLGVLLLAKLNFLCLEMLVVTFFLIFNQFWAELLQNQNLLLKILDPPLDSMIIYTSSVVDK